MKIYPQHVGKFILVHNGKYFVKLAIIQEMVNHKLGEFVKTKINISNNKFSKRKK